MDPQTRAVPVDDSGSQLFCTDSGAVPDSDDYATLVIVHGAAINTAVFQKLFPLCAKDNIRLVLVNRRPYAGTSPLSDEELEDLRMGKKSFMERRGAELARFLLWLIEREKIPPTSPDSKRGGIGLMGWSLGNAFVLSLLGHPDAIPPSTYTALESYLRKAIIYDTPMYSLGLQFPAGGYDIWKDPLCDTQEALLRHFGLYASTYYNHNLPCKTTADLDVRRCGDRSSLNNMTSDELVSMLETEALLKELPIISVMQPVISEQTRRALFDEELARRVLPRLEIIYLWCEATTWDPVWTARVMEERYKQAVTAGRWVRPSSFRSIAGANHFVHWDDPQAFWSAAMHALTNRQNKESSDVPSRAG